MVRQENRARNPSKHGGVARLWKGVALATVTAQPDRRAGLALWKVSWTICSGSAGLALMGYRIR